MRQIDQKRPWGEPSKLYSFQDFAEERRIRKDGRETAVRFQDIPAVLEAASFLVRLYRDIYAEGLFYPGNLLKSVYFDPATGQGQIQDRYGVKRLDSPASVEDLYNEYRAPELILGELAHYSRESENWTLAVFLYELFFHSRGPFRGHQSMQKVFFSPREEVRFMAEEGVCNLEENQNSNRPVYGVQDRLIKYQEFYPEELSDAFRQVFVDGKKDPSRRKDPDAWQILLNQMKTDYLTCACGNRGFAAAFHKTPDGHLSCPVCGQRYYIFESGESRIYLYNGARIYQKQIRQTDFDDESLIGVVMENRQRKGVFGVKNLSSSTWSGKGPDGMERPVAPGGGIPIWMGLRISFGENCTWRIRGAENDDGRNES